MSSPASLFFPAAWIKAAAQEPDDVDRWKKDYEDYVQYPRFYRDEQGVLKVDPHRLGPRSWTLGGPHPMKEPTNIFGRPSHRKYKKLLDKGTGWDDRPRKILPDNGTKIREYQLPNPYLRL